MSIKTTNQAPIVLEKSKVPDYLRQYFEPALCSSCYICHLVGICREIRRVVRKDGVFFLNIGDSYAGNVNRASNGGRAGYGTPREGVFQRGSKTIKPKDLCLIPFRVAISAQEDGWWVRSVIIWSKPNPMPESVRDRPTESHEYILLLTKSKNYYWDADAVREPYQPDSLRPSKRNISNPKGMDRQGIDTWLERIPKVRGYKTKRTGRGSNNPELGNRNFMPIQGEQYHGQAINSYPSGRNIRSVWEFATQPYPEAHFATFPEKLPEICIKAASKEGDLILDPFAGSGTTLLVASKLGRYSVGYELSEEYCEMIIERNRQAIII